MKIALLTPTFYKFSGIDRVVELDAERYSKAGHKVRILTFKGDIKPKNSNVEILGLPKNPTLQRIYRLFFFLDLNKINKGVDLIKDCDKVKCYFYPMTWIARKAQLKHGIHYEYWDAGVASPELFKSKLERLYLQFFTYLVNKSVKNADSAISISKYLQRELKQGAGLKSKVEYIKIDRKRFNKKVSGKRIRKKHKIKNEPVLLYIGRISPHKGVHLLIKSFRILRKKFPKAKLIIVGKHTFNKYSNQLKKFAGPNVIFTGFVPDKDIPEYYAACDVYTTTTLWEGYDLPIVESNACGKPAVAFDIGPHPEVLRKGELVPVGDVRAFAKAVEKLLLI